MKTIERTTQEYKTPKCKVVNVHMQKLLCSSPETEFDVDNPFNPSDEEEGI